MKTISEIPNFYARLAQLVRAYKQSEKEGDSSRMKNRVQDILAVIDFAVARETLTLRSVSLKIQVSRPDALYFSVPYTPEGKQKRILGVSVLSCFDGISVSVTGANGDAGLASFIEGVFEKLENMPALTEEDIMFIPDAAAARIPGNLTFTPK